MRNSGAYCGRILASLVLSVVAAMTHAEVTAQDPMWLRLGHYDARGGGYVSTVQTPEFFLAAGGKTDPAEELEATLRAMRATDTEDPNTHAQCRFPARYLWLRRAGALPAVARRACPQFDGWMFEGQPASVSIVFATGYLGNPASYYGHTLLKFNAPGERRRSELLDVTVNYGAIIPAGTGPLEYILRGAAGGFSAGFSHIQYYFHDHQYGDVELRDLWEYELNLPAEDVAMIVAHAWEVLGREFTYYFFRRNCAFRMAEVLEVIGGIEIIPPQRPWTVPQALVRRTNAQTYEGEPLVRRVTYRPSRQSRFYASYEQLSGAARTAARAVVSGADTGFDTAPIDALPAEARAATTDALLDYYQYRTPSDAAPDDPRRDAYRKLLAYRFSQPTGRQAPVPQPARDPASDRPPGYLAAGYSNNSSTGVSTTLQVRAAYYDALDASVSHVPDSELTMGDVEIELRDDSARLRKAQLFRVESVNGARSGLPGDNGKSWRLALGLSSQDLACNTCLVARFDGDVGRSRALGRQATVGAYVGGALQDNRNDNGNAFVRTSAYLNWRPGDRLSLRARYEHRRHLDGRLEGQDVFSLRARWRITQRIDARVFLQRNVAEQYGLSIGYYW
ncbi:MAG: DUF4105 domain-containing protein [Pseudomonadota bacterium]